MIKYWLDRLFWFAVFCIDRLQGCGDPVHVLSGNKLLLDPRGGSLPPQPHLHDFLLGQKVSMGIHSDWMGWVLLHLHILPCIWLAELKPCKLNHMYCEVFNLWSSNYNAIHFEGKRPSPLLISIIRNVMTMENLHECGLYGSCIVHTVRLSYVSTAHTMWMLCYPGSTHMSTLWTSYNFTDHISFIDIFF